MKSSCLSNSCIIKKNFNFRKNDTIQCRATRAAYEAIINKGAKHLLKDRRGIILGDEVGTGKTFEGLATAALYWKYRTHGNHRSSFRILLIVPNDALKNHWEKQIGIFFGNNNFVLEEDLKNFGKKLEVVKDSRCHFRRKGRGVEIVIYTQYQFRKGAKYWDKNGKQKKNIRWKLPPILQRLSHGDKSIDLLIVDEAHHLRSGGNFAKNLSKLIISQNNPEKLRVIFLTATPFQVNHITELTRLLSFLDRANIPNRIPIPQIKRGSTPEPTEKVFHADNLRSDVRLDEKWINTDYLCKAYKTKKPENEIKKRRRKFGAASAVEAIFLGLQTLSNGFEKIKAKNTSGEKLEKELADKFTSLDRDIDKNRMTRGRTLRKKALCFAKRAEKKWHIELAPAQDRYCINCAKKDKMFPSFAYDEPDEEGLDNYLRDFIVRNRKPMPKTEIPEVLLRWDEKQISKYLQIRERLLLSEKFQHDIDKTCKEEVSEIVKGAWHMHYLRLTSSFTAAYKTTRSKVVRENPIHPKIVSLLAVLRKYGVLLDEQKMKEERKSFQNNSYKDIGNRQKAVIFFESLDSIRAVKKLLKVEIKKEFENVTGLNWQNRSRKSKWRQFPENIKKKWASDCIAVVTGKTKANKDTKRKTRVEIYNEFNRKNEPPYILLSSKVGFEGIDLHRACDIVVHYDLHWNPTVIEQRTGRIYRGSKSKKRIKNIELCLPFVYDCLIKKAQEKRSKYKDFILGEIALEEFLERL